MGATREIFISSQEDKKPRCDPKKQENIVQRWSLLIRPLIFVTPLIPEANLSFRVSSITTQRECPLQVRITQANFLCQYLVTLCSLLVVQHHTTSQAVE